MLSLVEPCKHDQTISSYFLPQHATLEIPIKWQRVNSCAFCGIKSIVPLVISMTLNETESLRLLSNNDIPSEFQVNTMPKRKRDRISNLAKKLSVRHAYTLQAWLVVSARLSSSFGMNNTQAVGAVCIRPQKCGVYNPAACGYAPTLTNLYPNYG